MKSISVLITLLSLFALQGFAAAVKVGEIYYNLSGTEATVTSPTTKPKYSGDIVIPSVISYNNTNYTVTTIGERAFTTASCENVTSITIPSSVTKIESVAIMDLQNLQKFVFEDGTDPISVIYKDDPDYFYNLKIESLYLGRSFSVDMKVLPFSGEEFGGFFNLCNIAEIKVGSGVKEIPYRFICDPKQSKIVIPEGIETIGSKAFNYHYDTPVLEEVELPSTLKEIGESIFERVKTNSALTLTCASKNPPAVTLSNFFSSASMKPASFILRIPEGTEEIYNKQGWTDGIFTKTETFTPEEPTEERVYLTMSPASSESHFDIELAAEKGADLQFFIRPDAGWELISVDLETAETPAGSPGYRADQNEGTTTEISEKDADGRHTVTVHRLQENARLSYHLKKAEVTLSPVIQAASQPELRLIPTGFQIESDDETEVTVALSSGEIIATGRATPQQPFVKTGLARGLYLIRAGSVTFKLIR